VSELTGGVSELAAGVSGFASGIGSKIRKKEGDGTPPPLPETAYHVAVDGKAVGPLNIADLSELVREGRLAPDTLVWTKGMESWAEAQTVGALKTLFHDEDDGEGC
jgi:hypothetical protein